MLVENVPGGQYTSVYGSGQYAPTRHRVQEDEPAPAYRPNGQDVQVVNAVASSAEDAVPGGHSDRMPERQ